MNWSKIEEMCAEFVITTLAIEKQAESIIPLKHSTVDTVVFRCVCI